MNPSQFHITWIIEDKEWTYARTWLPQARVHAQMQSRRLSIDGLLSGYVRFGVDEHLLFPEAVLFHEYYLKLADCAALGIAIEPYPSTSQLYGRWMSLPELFQFLLRFRNRIATNVSSRSNVVEFVDNDGNGFIQFLCSTCRTVRISNTFVNSVMKSDHYLEVSYEQLSDTVIMSAQLFRLQLQQRFHEALELPHFQFLNDLP